MIQSAESLLEVRKVLRKRHGYFEEAAQLMSMIIPNLNVEIGI